MNTAGSRANERVLVLQVAPASQRTASRGFELTQFEPEKAIRRASALFSGTHPTHRGRHSSAGPVDACRVQTIRKSRRSRLGREFVPAWTARAGVPRRPPRAIARRPRPGTRRRC